MLDAGLNWRGEFFYGSFSAGVVPVFYLNQKQTLNLSPLMDPPSYSVSGGSASGPYYYLNLDMAFVTKYFSLFFTLFNEFSRLSYTSIDFDDNGAWVGSDITQDYKVLALEISLLLNLEALNLDGMIETMIIRRYQKKYGMNVQIGYGRTFDEATGGRNYLLIGIKKL